MPEVELVQESGSLIFISPSNSFLNASVFGNRISSVEWRQNDTVITQNTSGFIINEDVTEWSYNVSLIFIDFDASVQAGVYSLVATNPLGTFIIATWKIQKAGKFFIIIYLLGMWTLYKSLPPISKHGRAIVGVQISIVHNGYIIATTLLLHNLLFEYPCIVLHIYLLIHSGKERALVRAT